jgi:DNA replication protein DnaC
LFKIRNQKHHPDQQQIFSDWGELINDTLVATATLDRLLHHAHVINIWGGTYRLKSRLKSGVQTVSPVDITTIENLASD